MGEFHPDIVLDTCQKYSHCISQCARVRQHIYNGSLFLFKYNKQQHLHDNRLAFSGCYVMIIRDLVWLPWARLIGSQLSSHYHGLSPVTVIDRHQQLKKIFNKNAFRLLTVSRSIPCISGGGGGGSLPNPTIDRPEGSTQPPRCRPHLVTCDTCWEANRPPRTE